jgi:glycosyltransferase involved in cell wall biosynthesis
MKIFEVNALFPPECWGGAEVYVLNLTRRLKYLGHDVFVIIGQRGKSSQKSSHYDRLQLEGITVFRMPALHSLLSISDACVDRLFLDLLRESKPDIVHFHNFFHYLPASLIQIAKDEGLPIVQHLHDFWFMCPVGILAGILPEVCSGPKSGRRCLNCPATLFIRDQLLQQRIDDEFYKYLGNKFSDRIKNIIPKKVKKPLKKLLLQIISSYSANPDLQKSHNETTTYFQTRNNTLFPYLQQCDKLLCPSEFVYDKYLEWGLDQRNLTLFPVGIELSAFNGFQRAESDALRFGYIGALSQDKGVHILIRSFRELNFPDIRLNIWGTGSTSFYKQLLKLSHSDERIRFCGSLSNDEITKAFENMDVLIAPSLWPETYGLVIREAYATQTPVIASKIGAYEAAVDHGINGFLVEPGNIEQIAYYMKIIFNDRTLLQSMQSHIPAVRSIGNDALELDTLFRELIKSKKN